MSAEISGNATRKRLLEIEKELADLQEKKSALHQRWKAEKESITRIREMKAEIEQLRNKAADHERKGDLAKVAEIRYGTIMQLEQQVETENQHLASLQSTGKMLKEEVDASDIAEIVGKWTGIPVQKMLETERTKLLTMEDRIHQRVINQADAVKAISNAIRRSRAGLQDVNRPIGSFIFLGTTGVGKTEMARALAEFLFDDESAMIRIDMSEYMEKHAVSRLIGAPPGYVGYDEGGQLTEAVRQRPYSVVLLDEIEKAHPEVFNILLQVLDDGRLTDSKGREVNFKNTIIIMTSNLGTEILQDSLSDITEENRETILMEARTGIINLLKQRMRPEFLNRIDEIILFKPLTKSEIRQIAVLQMKKLQSRLAKDDITLNVTDDAFDTIVRLGYDVQYGARPLKRAIQKYVADQLSMHILGGDFSSGDVIQLESSETGAFEFKKV
ncbi:MAG: AAA family ATPase [Ignavibacteria bacterium]|jgi:ATP-dependent Clp protease ATP-binding subunit ClpB